MSVLSWNRNTIASKLLHARNNRRWKLLRKIKPTAIKIHLNPNVQIRYLTTNHTVGCSSVYPQWKNDGPFTAPDLSNRTCGKPTASAATIMQLVFSLSGNRTKAQPKRANAATKTGLFQYGSNPISAPQRMKVASSVGGALADGGGGGVGTSSLTNSSL